MIIFWIYWGKYVIKINFTYFFSLFNMATKNSKITSMPHIFLLDKWSIKKIKTEYIMYKIQKNSLSISSIWILDCNSKDISYSNL